MGANINESLSNQGIPKSQKLINPVAETCLKSKHHETRERAVILLQMLSQRSGLADQLQEMDSSPTGLAKARAAAQAGTILEQRNSRRTSLAEIREKRRNS